MEESTIKIDIQIKEDIQVVEIEGDIDASTATDVQKQVLPLTTPGSKILLNMTAVPYMSSAGLRMLLSIYRQAEAKEGKLALVGLSEELQDTMSVTGFLDFFKTFDNLEAGLKSLK